MNAQSVYSSIKQGILICDEQSRILYFNDSYAAFIGEKLEDVKGRLLREIRPGAIAPQVIKEGRPIQSVLRVEKGKEYFAVTDRRSIFVNKKNVETVLHTDIDSLQIESCGNCYVNEDYAKGFINLDAKGTFQGALLALICMSAFEAKPDRDRIRIV